MNKRAGQLGTVVFLVLIALALVALLAPLAGYRMDVVQSGSMEPSIGVGDLVITSPASPSEIKVGDVIAFRSPEGGTLICHRVVSINPQNGTMTTKGDANKGVDPFVVPDANIIGKIGANIPLLGYVIAFMKTPFGWALILLVALLLFFLGDGKTKGTNKKADKKEEGP